MRYLSIELVGYKRLMLNNIHRLKMNMTEIVQLILAKNGAGKSSLLWEISPNPSDASDYAKEGSKTIIIEKGGNTFVLRSSFGKKTMHSFRLGDEELNEGGTVSVQRKLVEEYFSYSEAIHEIVTGRTRFSLMSTAERRRWFIRFSPIEFDYALGVFDKIKKRHSEVRGGLETAKRRLVVEITKAITPEEELKLRSESEQLQSELAFLQEQRAPVSKSSYQYSQERQNKLREIEAVSVTILRMQSIDRPDDQRLTIKEIDDLLTICNNESSVITALMKQEVVEHDKLAETKTILEKTGQHGVQVLKEQLEALEAEQRQWESGKVLKLSVENPAAAISAVESIRDTISDVFTAIPSNENKQFNQATLQALKETDLANAETRLNLTQRLANFQAIRSRMDAHRSTNDATCPKCRFTWVQGYSEEAYKQNEVSIEEMTKAIEVLDEKIVSVKASLESFEEYRKLYAEFNRCVRNWPVIGNFFDHILGTELVFNFPRQVPKLLEQFRRDLDRDMEVVRCADKVKELSSLIFQVSQVGNANLADVSQKLYESDEKISQLTGRLTELRNRINSYGQYRRQISEMMQLGERLENLLMSQKKATEEEVETLRREAVSKCIQATQVALGKKADALQAIDSQKIIIADLTEHITKYTVQEETLKRMVASLSPAEGLIAEALNGSIKNFVNQMNHVIKKIWTYPLKVLECAVSVENGEELDYKFRVMVKDMSNITPDVKFCSSGQREVIDMVFKVMAMVNLGLGNAPLFLDEFGAAFDIEHRTQATQTIKSLMDTMSFSQLYMISHYETSYGSFSNAQICVLDPRGISVPSEYNQHVIIE
jgi:hypothetical protein